HIQEDVDIVQIQLQSADNGALVQHGGVTAKIAVHGAELLGVVSGKAHEDQQADGTQHNVKETEVIDKQHAEERDDEQGKESAHEHGAPAGQVFLGAHAVNGHDAEIQCAHQEGQNQCGEIVHHKVDAEVDAGKHRIGKEHGRCRA